MTTPSTETETAPMHSDILIIGSGPAGYTAAVYAARAGHTVTVLAGASQPGGALTTTTAVDNFPGFPAGIQGPTLMAQMETQALRFGAKVLFDDAVEVELDGPIKTVYTDGEAHTASAVIIATGSAYKHLGVPGEDTLAGVSYCATCDGFFFADKTVAVVGGGDSAAEESLYLAGFVGHVDLLVRSGAMRASKALVDRVMAHPRITVHFESRVAEITGDGTVEGYVLDDGTRRAACAVFVAIGHIPRSEMFASSVDLDAHGYVLTASTSPFGSERETATSVAGVFAAGDVADPTYRQAITAAASGCKSALDVHHYLQESNND